MCRPSKGGIPKGDVRDNSQLELLTDKIHEKIRKIKKKYEGLIPQHIEEILGDSPGSLSSSQTKEHIKKDEL